MKPPPRPLDAVLADAPDLKVRQRVGDATVVVRGITHDSRRVEPGDLFCCLVGEHSDGHAHAPEAVSRGAVALLVDRRLDVPVPQVQVDDTRAAVGPMAASVWGHPARSLITCGVTGTNGKTTTTHLLASVLEQGGTPTAILGTLSGSHTTPEATELQATLASFVAQGKGAVAMEVSSHALAMQRVDGMVFDVAVFTNLGRDHLDFHGTQERYFAAKARLFEPSLSRNGVADIDDPHGQLLVDAASVPMTSFSLEEATDLVVEATSSRFRWRGEEVRLRMGGRFNVANALAAATAASVIGVDTATIAAGLTSAAAVPGRFEPIDGGQDFAVVVDYAHTPDGLAEILRAARDAAGGHRVLVTFGCGGDRDPTKRPVMGATAAELADVVVVTSDNPRTEDPAAIMEAVLSGVPSSPKARVAAQVDRRAAIALVIGQARPGDVVIIAGKGHEATQSIAGRLEPFDDRVVARQVLAARP